MAQQSAKRIAPKIVETVFDISKSDLIPIVENASQSGPIVDLEIKIEHETQGKGTESKNAIATFYYQTKAKTMGMITLFVKHFLHTDSSEVHTYQAFGEVGIPTPKFYGHRLGPNGEEILFLELLPETGIDAKSEFEVLQCVRLVAQINTLPLPFCHFSIPEPKPNKRPDPNPQWIHTLTEIWEKAPAGELGVEIQVLCHENPDGFEILTDYAWYLTRQRNNFQHQGLINGDLSVNDFGWRITTSGKEIVAFDLIEYQIGPRFLDICNLMMGELLDDVVSYPKMGTHYLAMYNQLSGKSVTVDEFFDEVTFLSESGRYWDITFALEQAFSGKAAGDNVTWATHWYWLHRRLKELLESARAQMPFTNRSVSHHGI